MSVVPLRAKPPGSVYTDVLGRRWPVEKLDRLLADPEVRARVEGGAGLVVIPDEGAWSPAGAFVWARGIYTRESAAALLLALVVRYLDTDGAHLLGRGAVG